MNEILKLTLVELVERLQAKRLSPVELMETVLARIDETHEKLNAMTALRPREALLADARAAAERIARGEARALEGVPLGVKDLEDVAGLVTSMGSIPFREHVAERDSTQVARLRAAGAIVVGKTNAPEFGFTAITKNLVHGVTRSPWDLDRTPGGSSGGSAALLAGNVLPLVTSSDGGGSIRIPASFVGAFGLKPSFGRVARGPFDLWDAGDTVCYGPLTKTVADAALFLDVVAGPSSQDPTSLPASGLSYRSEVARDLDRKLRVGFSPDLGYAVVQSDVAAAVEGAARVFEKLGHHVETFSGGPPALGYEWGMTGSFELAAKLHELVRARPSDFGRAFLTSVEAGFRVTPEIWGKAAKSRARLNDWCAETFDRYDVIVTPTVPYDPPAARGPFPEETEGKRQSMFSVASFTIPFNLSGNPAATMRAGLSRAGLPIGMQIVGPRFADGLVLQASRAFERERPWHPQWPEI